MTDSLSEIKDLVKLALFLWAVFVGLDIIRAVWMWWEWRRK